MGKLEIIIFSFLGVFIFFVIDSMFFAGKRKARKKAKNEEKKQNKANAKLGEKKIEPAIAKTEKPTISLTESQPREKQLPVQEEEQELSLTKNEPSPFKIIRKQSKVKIHKKALNASSRNPSVTRVFAGGKRIDGIEEEQDKDNEDLGDAIKTIDSEELLNAINAEVGSFGIREPDYSFINTNSEFKFLNMSGGPNRAPIIGDRTNFQSRLNVSEDGNMSGVSGTGVVKIIEQASEQTEKINKKTTKMIKDVHADITGMFNPKISFLNVDEKKSVDIPQMHKYKDIDVETLIIADAISNPKYKNKKN